MKVVTFGVLLVIMGLSIAHKEDTESGDEESQNKKVWPEECNELTLQCNVNDLKSFVAADSCWAVTYSEDETYIKLFDSECAIRIDECKAANMKKEAIEYKKLDIEDVNCQHYFGYALMM